MSSSPTPGRDRSRPRGWSAPIPPAPLDPYERMVRDWAECGMRRLEAHLDRHAAFDRYLRERTGRPCPPPLH